MSITVDEANRIVTQINNLLSAGQGQKALDAAVGLRGRLRQACDGDAVLAQNLASVDSAIAALTQAGFRAAEEESKPIPWERIGYYNIAPQKPADMFRWKVPGGWFVMTREYAEPASAMTFYPDAEHSWKVD